MASLTIVPAAQQLLFRTRRSASTINIHPAKSYVVRRLSYKANRNLYSYRPSGVARATSEEIMLSDIPEPEDARGAITLGLKFSNAGDYEKALELFMKALKLPGTGVKRFRDQPPAISSGEMQAALYNVACCHSRMGNTYEGLAAIAGCLENGYEDLTQLRTDPDLANLRTDERFEGLIKRLVPDRSGFFGGLLKGFL